MDKRKEAIRRADAASRFLEHEQTKGLWAIIETDIYGAWVSSRSTDTEGREACYRELHGLRALKARLTRIIKEGRKAEEELSHEQRSRT